MIKINIKILSIFFILILFISFQILYVKIETTNYSSIITSIVWITLFIIAYRLNEGVRQRIIYKENKNQTIFIAILFYLISYFLLGLVLGYAKSIYSHNIISILKNTWNYAVIISLLEYVRNVIIVNNPNKKGLYILTIIIFTLYESDLYTFFNSNNNLTTLFKLFSSILLPALVLNILLSYLTKIGGYKSTLIYRLPIILTTLFLPILPRLNWYYTAVLGILFPFVVYTLVKGVHNKNKRKFRKWSRNSSTRKQLFLVTLIVFFLMFVAGIFKYYPVAIMSNSMQDIFKRGDVVIIQKTDVDVLDDIKQYDIIIFKNNDITIVHRVIDIEKRVDGSIYYITKGDNNNATDKDKISKSEVIGKVKAYVSKIGYPSVWLNEVLNRD